MEQIKKKRVAMICNFSNTAVRSHLPLDKRVLFTFARKLLRLPTKGNKYGDVAPWTTNTITYLNEQPDIELCVIAPHSGLKKRVVSFEMENVQYYFVACDFGNLLGKVIKNAETWIKVNPVGKRINKIVHGFKPDLVVLIGAENAFYAHSILAIQDNPVLVLCQTIYNNPERAQHSVVDPKCAYIERRIFDKEKYYGVYSRMHFDLLRTLSPKANIFKFGYPTKADILNPIPTEKEYDFVNFALSLDLKKGAHDSVKALAIVKKHYPSVTLNLVGGCNSENRKELDALIQELGLEENVVYTPFFEKRSDLFLHIQKSRFAVLPCKLDNVSGTMSQSMQLGLPIVVYKTTGTPIFNREKPCALIAEKENVNELANHMIALMENPGLADTLKHNARELQEKRIEYARHNGDRLMAILKAVISNHTEGTPISQELLFNPEKDD